MSLQDLVKDKPFDYRETKSGLVHISYRGKTVTTLSGKNGVRFISKVESSSEEQAQLAMAKATGHFKHGNEKLSKNKG